MEIVFFHAIKGYMFSEVIFRLSSLEIILHKKSWLLFLIMLPMSGSDQRYAIKLIDPFRITCLVNVMKRHKTKLRIYCKFSALKVSLVSYNKYNPGSLLLHYEVYSTRY